MRRLALERRKNWDKLSEDQRELFVDELLHEDNETEDVVQRFGSLHLSDHDRDIFMSAINNPHEPNDRLQRAAQRHGKEVAQ